jgi:multidrug resistance efflux pump
VHVEEGQEVAQGNLLAELEPFDLEARRAEAAAELARRQQVLRKLQAGFREEEVAQAEARYQELNANLDKLRKGPRDQEIVAAEARLELAQSQLQLAQLQFERMRSLVEDNAAAQDELDEATNRLQVARAEVRVQQEHLSLLRAGTREEELREAEARMAEAEAAWKLTRAGYRPEEIAEAQAALEAAEATLQAVQLQIDDLAIRAPSRSIVEAIELEPGDLVAANAPAISLIEMDELWVRAYVPEDELDLRIGQPVAVTVDSYPDRIFAGRVSFIARQGEFTPRNVQTPQERSEQVFRIKVMLPKDVDLLRPGMIADVWLEPRSDRTWPKW